MLFFGPGMRIWLLIALNFACMGIYTLVSRADSLSWLTAGADDNYPPYVGRIAMAIYTILLYGVPAIVLANVFPPERFGWFRLNRKVSPMLVLLGVLAIILASPGFGQIQVWVANSLKDPQLLEYEKLVQKENDWALTLPTIGDLFGCLALNALVPALCEELFFRGALQQLTIEWTKRTGLGIFVTAFFFAIIHFNLTGFPVIFIAGLMLGFAYHWTGSLRTTVMMHFMFNAVSIIEAYLSQHNQAVREWEPSAGLSLGGLALAGGLMFLLWRRTQAPVKLS